jgi:hypothetical protein
MLARLRSSGLVRPLVASATLVVLYAAYVAWLHVVGARVLPASELAGDAPVDVPIGVAVTLAVDPEPFHMAKLQALGRVVEVRERTAFIVDVTPRDAQALARNYWVARIRRWRQP